MKKPLYNENDSYTPEGNEVADEVYKVLLPLMRGYAERFSMREVAHMISAHVFVVESEIILTRQMKSMKERRAEKFGVGVVPDHLHGPSCARKHPDWKPSMRCNCFGEDS